MIASVLDALTNPKFYVQKQLTTQLPATQNPKGSVTQLFHWYDGKN